MPIDEKHAAALEDVARHAEEFARLFRAIPVVKDGPTHPAVGPMLRAFQSINKALGARDRRGWVPLAQQRRMGQGFHKIGDALLILPERTAQKAKRPRKRTR